MLIVERPGVFLGRAFNADCWYVVDTSYAKFEKDVIAEWRKQHRGTNRPGWMRPLTSIGVPLLLLGLLVASFAVLPPESWTAAMIAVIVFGLVVFVVLLRIADIRWPGVAPAGGHHHAVLPIEREIAGAATDRTGWNDLWEVSQALYRVRQAHALREQLDGDLEYLHAPDERRVITAAREEIDALAERREAEFDAITEWSTMFHERLGVEDKGEA